MAGSLNVNTSESVRALVATVRLFVSVLALHSSKFFAFTATVCYTATTQVLTVAAIVAQPLRAAPYSHVAGS